MTNDTNFRDRHVGEYLSGLVDGELTQQDRQRVLLHCEQCPECSQNLADLQALRGRMGKAGLSTLGEDVWRENITEKVEPQSVKERVVNDENPLKEQGRVLLLQHN